MGPSDPQLESLDPTEAHIASVEPLKAIAFAAPAPSVLATGAVVWVSDHYNTAIVMGPGQNGTWHVVMTDDDGSLHECDCAADDLRPASQRVEFRLPAVR